MLFTKPERNRNEVRDHLLFMPGNDSEEKLVEGLQLGFIFITVILGFIFIHHSDFRILIYLSQ